MSALSTHVLDAVRGTPAAGVTVTLYQQARQLDSGETGADGRIRALGEALEPGTYRLVFDTGAYFTRQGVETFYPEVSITFTMTDERRYHVPLLLSPFAFSTYRGS
ncbi:MULTISPECIES: hydroxyisourate hydrolase [Nocardia]|uniref:5-hydroxyisourate hydrolase n=1 Tax=Nocardia sputorum TaxID=2984338 RepID=A0ABM8D5U7_9NOCA|nr:hydroxyisourate hydrolase [Nocardia sputorum]BDT93859.1 5-hydroxyisourate hydrolase [Nocardia sputorum]BDU02805.1 5-hydroxyisourate hydrolase [Nocardia sputorum]